MDVVVVGHKWIFAYAQSVEEDSNDVKTWYHEWRKGYYQRMICPNDTWRWNGNYFDAQQRKNETYGQRSSVAHKDFFLFLGIAKYVVIEKRHDDS